MPLLEAEELELLELEKEQALSSQRSIESIASAPAGSYGKTDSYPISETFAKYAEPISQFGGAFARKTAVGIPLAGLATGSVEAVKQGLQRFEGNPEAPETSAEAARRIGMAGARGAGGELGGRAVLGAASYIGRKALPVAAQGIRAMTGVPVREATAVLKDPSILSRAKSVEEAGADYAASLTGGPVVGLESGAKGARKAFGKSHLSPDAVADKFDELLPHLQAGTIDLQTAFSLRQQTMDKLADLPYNEKSMKKLLAENVDQLDEFIESKLPEWSGARKAFRESKVAEEFKSWLPLNKNLSPNVLRTAGALTAAAHGISEGRVLPMLALPAVSPRVYGGAIRAAASPITRGIVQGATRLGTQAGAGAIFPSSTTEALRRRYMGLK